MVCVQLATVLINAVPVESLGVLPESYKIATVPTSLLTSVANTMTRISLLTHHSVERVALAAFALVLQVFVIPASLVTIRGTWILSREGVSCAMLPAFMMNPHLRPQIHRPIE
jgi:hypothetical protein